MLIREILEEFDALVPNSLDAAIKLRWISDLDLQVNREILMPRHMGRPCFEGYFIDTDMECNAMIPAGYTEIYRHYMEAQNAAAMHEDGTYNRAVSLFNQKYQAYADWVNRTKPVRPTYLRIV